jgi:hypothetical protein
VTAPFRPVTVWLRLDDRTGGHTHLSVFVGRDPGSRGHAGVIVLRNDELEELIAAGYLQLADGLPPGLVPAGMALEPSAELTALRRKVAELEDYLARIAVIGSAGEVGPTCHWHQEASRLALEPLPADHPVRGLVRPDGP